MSTPRKSELWVVFKGTSEKLVVGKEDATALQSLLGAGWVMDYLRDLEQHEVEGYRNRARRHFRVRKPVQPSPFIYRTRLPRR